MPWTVPRPQDRWSDREIGSFLREIFTRIKFGSFTWDPPSVSANTTVDTTLTTTDAPQVEGLRTGMSVKVTPPSTVDAGLLLDAWVPADDQLTVRLRNVTGSGINMTSTTWSFMGVLV
jgi:hypothetical protein